jgi:hypothetical protein
MQLSIGMISAMEPSIAITGLIYTVQGGLLIIKNLR